jgi:peroxiredoxin
MIFRIVLVIAAVLAFSSQKADAAINVGDKAPALIVKDITGKDINLSDMEGKTVIVTLWASWCQPCQAEMPMLRDFYHKYEDKGVEIIALSLDRPHDKKAVEKIAAKVDYHVAMASEASANGFDSTSSLPATYVINSEGNVSAVFDQKPVTEAELARVVPAGN